MNTKGKILIIISAVSTILCVFYLTLSSPVQLIGNENNAHASAILTSFMQSIDAENCEGYSGAWIDDNDKAHIAFINLDYKEQAERKGIVYDVFSHTFTEIVKLQDEVSNDPRLEGKINGTSVSESENALEIDYYREADLKSIKAVTADKNEKKINIRYNYKPEPNQNAPGRYEGIKDK